MPTLKYFVAFVVSDAFGCHIGSAGITASKKITSMEDILTIQNNLAASDPSLENAIIINWRLFEEE